MNQPGKMDPASSALVVLVSHNKDGDDGEQTNQANQETSFDIRFPLGYISIAVEGSNSTNLVRFGVFPPAVEASTIQDPSSWREIKVCPPPSVLESSGKPLQCPVGFCTDVLKRNQTYENHIKKHLTLIIEEQSKILRLSEPLGLPENLPIRYYCINYGCYNGMEMYDKSRSFGLLKYLKQHHLKMHAPKTFTCTSCSKSFATESFLGVHTRNCGNSFDCSTCETKYYTLETLQTHCRRKSHIYDYTKYKNILTTAKEKAKEQKKAEKDLKQKSEANKTLPTPPVYVLVPRTCNGHGIGASHISWTYNGNAGPQDPKLKVEMSTQTDVVEDESPPASSSSPAKETTEKSKKVSRRKRSAETQTTKQENKISTESQTLNVTKRRRTTKKHIAEAETQCCVVTEPPLTITAHDDSEIMMNSTFLPEPENNYYEVNTLTTPNEDLPVDEEADVSHSGISLRSLMSLVGIDSETEIEISQEDAECNLFSDNDIDTITNNDDDNNSATTEGEINTPEINWDNISANSTSTHYPENPAGLSTPTSFHDMDVESSKEIDHLLDQLSMEELHRETQTDAAGSINFSNDFEGLFATNVKKDPTFVTTETQTGCASLPPKSVEASVGPAEVHLEKIEIDQSTTTADAFGMISDSDLFPISGWNSETFANSSQTDFLVSEYDDEFAAITSQELNSRLYMETIDGETQTGAP